MDLMLRGRGAEVGVRAPVWLIRICGACLGVAASAIAEMLGSVYVSGFSATTLRIAGASIGALLATTSLGSLLWFGTGALVAVVMLVSLTPIAGPFGRSFVRSDSDTGNVDAIVVLSGTLTDDGRLSGQVVDRLLTALAQVQERHVPQLALSVVDRTINGRKITTEADQRELVTRFGSGVDVRFVHDVHSTRDEALAFSAMARTHQWNRVLLITSPTHTKRACRAMEVVGLKVQCMPAQSRDYSLTSLHGPQARLLVFQDAIYETAATILYRARGWN